MLNGVPVPPDRANAARTVAAVLGAGGRVALTTHVNADGDGVGSEVALWHLLADRGVTAVIANPTPIPERFGFLVPNGADHSGRAAKEIEAADVVVVLDISDVGRLGDLQHAIKRSHAVACLDHHVSAGSLPEGPRLVTPEAAATAELVFDLASAVGWPLTPEAARALYVGILTDTGAFRFANTSPRVLRVAGALLECGVDPESIYETVYASAPEGRVRLMTEVLETLVVERERGLAWVTVPPDALQRHGATADDLDGIVEYPRSIAGVRLALLFRQLANGKVKVSFRSVGDVDVAELAQQFGGGGHRKAAGASLDGTLAEAQAAVLAAARSYLDVRAGIAQPGCEIQIAREQPAPLRLEQCHVVGRVAGRVDHPESKPRRFEHVAQRSSERRWPATPRDAAIQLEMRVRLGETRYRARVRERGDAQLRPPQAMDAGVILVMMCRHALPHGQLAHQPPYVA